VPPRAVVDNNLAISFLLTHGATMGELFGRWRKEQFVYVTSPVIVDELREVVGRPRFKGRWANEPAALLDSIDKDAVKVEGVLVISGACRDPKDDKLLACAVEGQVDYLVSGDTDLLDLGEYQGIRIVTPRQFVQLLDEPPTA
jgi:hypothetical protein